MNKKQPIDGSKCKPLSLEEAKNLNRNSQVYFRFYNTSLGTLGRVRVNGEIQVWKRNPDRVRVPWKYGIWEYGEINENNLTDYTLESKPYERFENVRVCPATGDEAMLAEYTWAFVEENGLNQDVELIQKLMDITDILNGEKGDLGFELYEQLPDLMNNYAPEGYYYGTHQSDGEWGFWPVEPYDITMDHIQD